MSKRIFLSALVSGFAFCIGLLACFLLTPLLWKLEPILGLELAGHSGPADWLVVTFGCVFAFFGFFLAFKRVK